MTSSSAHAVEWVGHADGKTSAGGSSDPLLSDVFMAVELQDWLASATTGASSW